MCVCVLKVAPYPPLCSHFHSTRFDEPEMKESGWSRRRKSEEHLMNIVFLFEILYVIQDVECRWPGHF